MPPGPADTAATHLLPHKVFHHEQQLRVSDPQSAFQDKPAAIVTEAKRSASGIGGLEAR